MKLLPLLLHILKHGWWCNVNPVQAIEHDELIACSLEDGVFMQWHHDYLDRRWNVTHYLHGDGDGERQAPEEDEYSDEEVEEQEFPSEDVRGVYTP